MARRVHVQIVIAAIAVSAMAETKVVMLGTGNPAPEPERSGPAVAVVVDGEAFLVDMGPGVVRRMTAAAQKTGLREVYATNVRTVFVTHLHSDHTLGYADLILTPWVVGRTTPLEVYGPPGLEAMTEHLLKAYAQDIEIRLHGLERAGEAGLQVEAKEIEPGAVYDRRGVKVTAIKVDHGTWPHAYGYRFDTPGRVVVISGDTGPSENLEKHAMGCDVLVHEVYSAAALARMGAGPRAYHSTFHTSGVELGKIAARVQPKLLVLYHNLAWSPVSEVLEEIREHYGGAVVMSEDLDVF